MYSISLHTTLSDVCMRKNVTSFPFVLATTCETKYWQPKSPSEHSSRRERLKWRSFRLAHAQSDENVPFAA